MWYPQLRDKRPRAYRLQLPSAAHSRAQKHSHVMEHTGYIALPSAAHSGAQKHSHVMVPLAARQAPKSIPATLRCPQLRTEAQPCHGTPSCATRAQERTGHIMNPNIHAVVPLAARQAPKSVPAFCQLPSAAHSRAQKHSHVMVPLAARPASAQEHTGYIALPSAARSGAQKHSHVMVPLAARQAPKSVPVTS